MQIYIMALLDWLGRWEMSQIQVLKEETPNVGNDLVELATA